MADPAESSAGANLPAAVALAPQAAVCRNRYVRSARGNRHGSAAAITHASERVLKVSGALARLSGAPVFWATTVTE